jgi:uncharacterized protein YicC (UPF0701 family)
MVSLIIAVCTLLGAGIGVWKMYYSTGARVTRLQKQRDEITERMEDALQAKDMDKYYALAAERVCLNKEISRLRR